MKKDQTEAERDKMVKENPLGFAFKRVLSRVSHESFKKSAA